jgi:hypothetical protein
VHPAKSTKNARHESCLPTISFASSLSEHMGLHPLQDYKERRCQDQQKNMRNWYIFYRILRGACILFEFAIDLILQNTWQISSQSTGMLHLSKFMANLITFKTK